MMDCEQYGANVFEVIDLINRDYPRGGIAQPGLTAGTCLRKDFAFSEERSQRAGHAAGRLARATSRVPLFLVEGIKRRLGLAARPQGRGARARRSSATPTTSATRSSHKLIRLLERELADVAVHDPHVADADRSRSRRRVRDADVVVVATNHSEFRDARDAARRSPTRAAARLPRRRPVELPRARRRCSRYAAELAPLRRSAGARQR